MAKNGGMAIDDELPSTGSWPFQPARGAFVPSPEHAALIVAHNQVAKSDTTTGSNNTAIKVDLKIIRSAEEESNIEEQTLGQLWAVSGAAVPGVENTNRHWEVSVAEEQINLLFGPPDAFPAAKELCLQQISSGVKLYTYRATDGRTYVGLQTTVVRDKISLKTQLALMEMYDILRSWVKSVEAGEDRTLGEMMQAWNDKEMEEISDTKAFKDALRKASENCA